MVVLNALIMQFPSDLLMEIVACVIQVTLILHQQTAQYVTIHVINVPQGRLLLNAQAALQLIRPIELYKIAPVNVFV